MLESLGLLGLLIAFFLAILPLLLLARVSHWTYHTQKKLDMTNKLLEAIWRRMQMEDENPNGNS